MDDSIFEEAALAKEIEVEVPEFAHLEEHHFTEPLPIVCKWCGSVETMKYGFNERGVQEYICSKCHRKFTAEDTPYYRQSPIEQIGASLNMYYDGLSFADVARNLAENYKNPVNESTVYRWIMSYTEKAIREFEPLKPNVGNIWVADETAIKFNEKIHWLWDIIDKDTRFLLATYLTPNRGTREARILMETASKKANKTPKTVVTDKLAGYLDGIELAFGSDTQHIQSSPFTIDNDNDIIERFQGTIKERTKVIRGFKTIPTANIILGGFLVHYNYFRPHLALKGKTPAEVAGIKLSYKTWNEFVRSDK